MEIAMTRSMHRNDVFQAATLYGLFAAGLLDADYLVMFSFS